MARTTTCSSPVSSYPSHGEPLPRTAAQVSAVASWFEMAVPDPDGGLPPAATPWQVCSDVLAGPAALQELRTTLEARHRAAVPALTVEAWVRAWYLCVPAYAGGLCFGLARRVPRLSPRSLAVGLEDARPARVALLSPRFACLPDDPDAGSPSAEVLPDARALAARLRAEVVAHAAAFLAVEPRTVRRGPHQLWGAVLDALDEALQLSGELRGPAAGVADARLALPWAEPPLPSGSTTRLVDLDGRATAVRERITCCYNDKLPGLAGELCAGCPRDPAGARTLPSS